MRPLLLSLIQGLFWKVLPIAKWKIIQNQHSQFFLLSACLLDLPQRKRLKGWGNRCELNKCRQKNNIRAEGLLPGNLPIVFFVRNHIKEFHINYRTKLIHYKSLFFVNLILRRPCRIPSIELEDRNHTFTTNIKSVMRNSSFLN